MKPNDPHHWKITLCQATESAGPMRRPKLFEYTGDIEGALQAADEAESEVDFEVQQFVITRGLPANENESAAMDREFIKEAAQCGASE